jgi:hypothetical protein
MNAAGTPHSHVYHIAMITCACIAALTFVFLVMLMVVTEKARLKRTIAHSRVWCRVRIGFVLAAATGLPGSLPFALANGTHTVLLLLVREVGCAVVIAMGALTFAVVLARAATGQIEFGNYEPHETAMFDDGSLHRINPASGLPMNGALDFAGNLYGWDSDDLGRDY